MPDEEPIPDSNNHSSGQDGHLPLEETLMRSFEDIRAARTYPAKEAIEQIAAKLGLTLERTRWNEV